jgi:hypothetical protein
MSIVALESILRIGDKIIDRVFPDKVAQEKERADARLALMTLDIQETTAILGVVEKELEGQLSVNEAEAKSGNLFVAGWRPFIGWTCGAAFAYKYVVAPILIGVLSFYNVTFNMPVIALDEMLPILLGMLGLGAFRTYEKVKGAAK